MGSAQSEVTENHIAFKCKNSFTHKKIVIFFFTELRSLQMFSYFDHNNVKCFQLKVGQQSQDLHFLIFFYNTVFRKQ